MITPMTDLELKIMTKVADELGKARDDFTRRGKMVTGKAKESQEYLAEMYTIAYDIVRGMRDAGVWIDP